MKSKDQSEARSRAPLLNDNRFKLCLFAFNLTGGQTISTAEGVNDPTWEENLKLAQMADGAGLEALIPVGRWIGFGGPSQYHAKSFEAYTWAAGLGALTSYSMVVATGHVPAMHPIVAAKQSVTVDPHHQRALRAQPGVRLVHYRDGVLRLQDAGPRRTLRAGGGMAGSLQALVERGRRVRLRGRFLYREAGRGLTQAHPATASGDHQRGDFSARATVLGRACRCRLHRGREYRAARGEHPLVS